MTICLVVPSFAIGPLPVEAPVTEPVAEQARLPVGTRGEARASRVGPLRDAQGRVVVRAVSHMPWAAVLAGTAPGPDALARLVL